MTKEEPIHLEPHNPNWLIKFESEKQLVDKTLSHWIKGGIHHVGSTAVPSLIAKPIVDVMVGVEDLEKAKECVPLLESIGYKHFPYKPHQMHWFCKPSPEQREFHLYLMKPTDPEWSARQAFRDYLISHPDIALEYAELKTSLAAKFPKDREAYTEGKSLFVKSVSARALRIRG